MRRLSLLIFFATLVCRALSAQITLSGEAESSLNLFPTFPYDGGRFESPVNPGNIYQLHDVAFDTDLTFKLEAGEEAATATLWLAAGPYELAQLLLTAASGDPVQEAAVAEGLPARDPAALSILRANVAWYAGSWLVLRLGRQSMLTGYGYGWNPMDFAGAAKDPFDPEAELRGVDALSLQLYLGNLFALKLAGLFRFQAFTGAGDFDELQGAAELTAFFPNLEVKLSGFYEYDGNHSEDAFVPALGAGFMLDLAGVGVYGEGALLWGSRTLFPMAAAAPERKEKRLLSGLLGLEYTFASELRLIAEYFYNGEGYSLAERRLYAQNLEDPLILGSELLGPYLSMYRPGYFSRQYLLVNLGYPIFSWNSNVELSAYYSPDSWALGIMPAFDFEISGNLSLRASYMALISLKDDQYDEARLSPLKHILELGATYFF